MKIKEKMMIFMMKKMPKMKEKCRGGMNPEDMEKMKETMHGKMEGCISKMKAEHIRGRRH